MLCVSIERVLYKCLLLLFIFKTEFLNSSFHLDLSGSSQFKILRVEIQHKVSGAILTKASISSFHCDLLLPLWQLNTFRKGCSLPRFCCNAHRSRPYCRNGCPSFATDKHSPTRSQFTDSSPEAHAFYISFNP